MRRYRADLEQAYGALARVAESLPIAPDAPSLWPILERRMEAHGRPGSPSPRMSPRVTSPGQQDLAGLDSERPLRSAWMRDSLEETLEMTGLAGWVSPARAGLDEPADRRLASGRSGWKRARVVGAGAAAAVLALIIGLPAIHRQESEARSIIRANAEPRAGWDIMPGSNEEEPSASSNLADDRGIPANELAQAEPIPVPEPPSTPAGESPPTSRTTTPSRWNYDLEHGIPMPQDARDSKPVY